MTALRLEPSQPGLELGQRVRLSMVDNELDEIVGHDKNQR